MTFAKLTNSTLMSGGCYFTPNQTENKTYTLYPPADIMSNKSFNWALGYSVHMPDNSAEILLSAPLFDNRGNIFRYRINDINNPDIPEFNSNDNNFRLLFGFAITSGQFDDSNSIQYAASDPIYETVTI